MILIVDYGQRVNEQIKKLQLKKQQQALVTKEKDKRQPNTEAEERQEMPTRLL